MTNAITIDPVLIQSLVEQAVEKNILSTVESLCQDQEWLARIEHMINQTVTLETISRIGSIDINSIICQRVDTNMTNIKKQILTDFVSTGISDQATSCQLTIMDDTTVVENQLTAAEISVTGSAIIRDLAVLGSINTDNSAWATLANNISDATLAKLSDAWRDQLVQQVADQIGQKGIDFDSVSIGGDYVITGNRLSSAIVESNLQSLGTLRQLSVQGEAHINNTVSVVNGRLGVNTELPEAALSVWDEEVAVIIGKHKSKHAFIGTSRDQTLCLGVNRTPYLEIDSTGLTMLKKLQVGVHKFSHAAQVPGWSGTRGDMVFNSNPGSDRVFAWMCIGGFNWQELRSAE